MRAPRKEKAMQETLTNLKSQLDLFQTLAKTVQRELKKRGITSVGECETHERLGLQLEFDPDAEKSIVFSHCLGGGRFADLENCQAVLFEAIWASNTLENRGVTLEKEETLLEAVLFGGNNNGLRLELLLYLEREDPHVTLELTKRDDEWVKIFITPHSCGVDKMFEPDSQLESLYDWMAIKPKDKAIDLPKRRLNKMLEKMADFYLIGQVPEPTKRGAKKS